jgi:hypothetical protein
MCTGLEPLLVSALGMTAGATSTALTATALGAAGAGALAKKVLPKAPAAEASAATAAAKQAPEAPPAKVQAPERPKVVQNNATAAGRGGAMAGNSSTFLTGPSGVDPSTLNLGRNTLLGQ